MVTVHLHLSARGWENLTLGHCAGGNSSGFWSCALRAVAFVDACTTLGDKTNGTSFYPAQGSGGFHVANENVTGCGGQFYGCGNSSSGANATFSISKWLMWTFNVTSKSTHRYLLSPTVDRGAWAQILASGTHIRGGMAKALLLFGLYGTGGNLTSVGIR